MIMNFTFFGFWEDLGLTNNILYKLLILLILLIHYYLKTDLSKLQGSLGNENIHISSSSCLISYIL